MPPILGALPCPRTAMPDALPARVLLVEDNLDDERIALRALRRGGLPLDVRVARDGREATTALGLGGAAPGFEPDLVLLGLGEGCEGEDGVLSRSRREPRLAGVPIVVLASAVDEDAEARCLAAGASAHAAKPIELDAYTAMVQGLVASWLPPADGRP